jgi:hypothetical protein
LLSLYWFGTRGIGMADKKCAGGKEEPLAYDAGVLPTLKRAYFLVLPHAHLLDLAGPLQIVATLRELGIAQVAVECISPQANIRTFQEVALREIRPLPARLVEGDVLFVIGSKLDDALMQSPAWREAVACAPAPFCLRRPVCWTDESARRTTGSFGN